MSTRREQILGTAAELFARRGFHGVSASDLGAAVGTATTTRWEPGPTPTLGG